jgi:hypothetical protein
VCRHLLARSSGAIFGHEPNAAREQRREIMKAILSALLGLSVLAAVTLSASAADEYDFPSDVFKKIERNLP